MSLLTVTARDNFCGKSLVVYEIDIILGLQNLTWHGHGFEVTSKSIVGRRAAHVPEHPSLKPLLCGLNCNFHKPHYYALNLKSCVVCLRCLF